MIKINLLPAKAVRKDTKNREFAVIAILAGVAVALVIGLLGSAQARKLSAKEAEIARLNADIEALNKKVREVDSFKAKQATLRKKLNIIERLRRKKTGPVRILDDLSLGIPDEVWLKSFREDGINVYLKGSGLTDESISAFLQKMERSEYFENVELLYIKPGTEAGKRVREFEIQAAIVLGGESMAEEPGAGGKGQGKRR